MTHMLYPYATPMLHVQPCYNYVTPMLHATPMLQHVTTLLQLYYIYVTPTIPCAV